MTDWQIGDLAVCVKRGGIWCPHSPWMYHRGERLPEGAATVSAIRIVYGERSGLPCGCTALEFEDGTVGSAVRFRKIRPDAREACEEEFVTLLKRSKRTVTASDWLLRAGPIARQLNKEASRD